MKKYILLIAFLIGSIMLTFAQSNTTDYIANQLGDDRESMSRNDTIIYITNQPGETYVCLNRYDGATIYGENNCSDFYWRYEGQFFHDNPLIIEGEYGISYYVTFYGCDFEWTFLIEFEDDRWVPTPFTQQVWKHQNEIVTLQAVGNDSIGWYNYHWSTGETTASIEVGTGTYICTITDYFGCGTAVRTFIVKDNVEIVSASVDPGTNKNLVTWDVTPEQATYISNVIVNRDGVDIATVPYTDGQFLDNIGSDLAARIYTIVGVCPDGTLCPIQSLSRGTIHMAFLPDINGNVEMTWNQPELGGADIHVGRFEICEYDPNSNEINVIDFVSSVTTSYSCNLSMFDYGYPLIRAVIQDGRGERDILSNRTNEIVGQPHEITINLTPGWTWISYPYAVALNIASALGDFVPMEGDCIKSQFGAVEYWNGQWMGSLQQFTPGFGYMYYSSRIEPVTLMFGESTSRSMRKYGVKE